jgi:tetratricopeptide (TPR) repeat protein
MPPAVEPQGDDRYLIDPRTGSTAVMPPPVQQRFEAAWRHTLAGNDAGAQQALADLRQRAPGLVPATLLEAVLAIRGGRYDEAHGLIARVRAREPENLAARVYEAEIAVRERQTRIAVDLYRAIVSLPEAPPAARERFAELEGALFNELYAAALAAPEADSIRLLREALALNAGAIEPRVLLARKLVGQKSFEEARRELEPLLGTAADRPDVQEILAEIDVGRGRYQEAIVRLDRLARRTGEARYAQRLEQIKSDWSALNMPAHYRAALESTEITRSDLAVLLYWTVPSIRFATNLGTPQIAVDVEDVAGRDEIIRALALGLYDVDPVTRRVGPYRTVSAARLSHHLARVLTIRGATCARGVPHESVLTSCAVTDPLSTHSPEAVLTGRELLAILQQLARQL